ncbi:unnamed protein product, partial [Porites evermanni]
MGCPMSSLTQNNTYTVALEWLFNSSKFLAEDNTFLALYGVEGHVEQVPDVYDDQPVINSSQTTTETITTSTGDKKASTTPKNQGQVNTRPLFLSCNLSKSEYGNKAIMKA